jgi:hypothetical protein
MTQEELEETAPIVNHEVVPHHASEEEEAVDPILASEVEVRVYHIRWYILTVFSILGILQASSQNYKKKLHVFDDSRFKQLFSFKNFRG